MSLLHEPALATYQREFWDEENGRLPVIEMEEPPSGGNMRRNKARWALAGVLILALTIGAVALVGSTTNKTVKTTAKKEMIAEAAETSTGRYYREVAEKTWTEARDFCRNKGDELAMIKSASDQAAVNAACGNYVCWVGGEKVAGEWKWMDGSLFSYTHWKPGAPNNWQGNENCLFMVHAHDAHEDGLWDDGNCAAKAHFVCEKPLICPHFEIPITSSTCGSPIVVPQSLDDLKANAAHCEKNTCMFIRGPNRELINYHSQCSCTVSTSGSQVEVKTTWGTSPRVRTYVGSSSTGEADYRKTDLVIYKQTLSVMDLPPNESANKFFFAVVGEPRNVPAQMSFKPVGEYLALSNMLKNGYCPPFKLAVGGDEKSFLGNEFICRLWSGADPYVFLVGYQTTSNPERKFGFKVTFRTSQTGVSLKCVYYEIDSPPVLLSNWNHKWYGVVSADDGGTMAASSHIPANFVCSSANVLVEY